MTEVYKDNVETSSIPNNIAEVAKKIRTTKYGKDMRESIAQGFELIDELLKREDLIKFETHFPEITNKANKVSSVINANYDTDIPVLDTPVFNAGYFDVDFRQQLVDAYGKTIDGVSALISGMKKMGLGKTISDTEISVPQKIEFNSLEITAVRQYISRQEAEINRSLEVVNNIIEEQGLEDSNES
ncbi:hypothetical protein PLO_1607 [Pediococcus acidilactici NGRI 0510Q]|uniref:hypothetical protein n=1 Tax=Pediococcus acidilactici TaxID=1254 RepID=UPI00029E9A8D|nr:hypothetical protein [Pediococcus acidilactici]GAC46135.1 hypothetical protein PLO_1607 [Pediococcus acidilactici NGRI 0510Q]KAF0342433.1 hypothetical protein GBO41_09400 [Pediococcus acidilactici]KRN89941.1 hypothetical protein IV82_GL001959 [Pediococcus acidilactici]QQC13476.1 hypothetical protein I6H64_05465 [Pediococcus acidilactici]TLQ00588.1 hypothetical protein FEZ49_02545 [Pediococcus acidilactici]